MYVYMYIYIFPPLPYPLTCTFKVIKGFCPCLGGKKGDCVHVACVLCVAECIDRPPDCIVQSSATSKSCWWNNKSKWMQCRFDINQALSCLPYVQVNAALDMLSPEPRTKKRKRHMMAVPTEGRALLVPSTRAAEYEAAVQSKIGVVTEAVQHVFECAERANEKCRLAEPTKRTAHPRTGDKSAFEVSWGYEWEHSYLRGRKPPVRACLSKLRSEIPNGVHPPPKPKRRDVVSMDDQGQPVSKLKSAKGQKQRIKRQEYEQCDGGRDCHCHAGSGDMCPQRDLVKCTRCGDVTVNGCTKKGCKTLRDKEEATSSVVVDAEVEVGECEIVSSPPCLHVVSTVGLLDNVRSPPASAPAADQAVHDASSPPCTPSTASVAVSVIGLPPSYPSLPVAVVQLPPSSPPRASSRRRNMDYDRHAY